MNSILHGKTISLQLIDESDAEFILSLRMDERYNRYLSKVENNIEKQIEWIRRYKEDENERLQFYFIVKHKEISCGTVRIYDLRDDSFSWGSWILNENKSRYAAVESALLVYRFGFEELKFRKSHFEVIKENDGVIEFHNKFGAEIIGEDTKYFYFEFSYKQYLSALDRYRKFIDPSL